MPRISITFLLLCILTATIASPEFASAKEPPNQPVSVRVHDAAGKTLHTFHPFGNAYYGRASITSGDVDGDGNEEIIVGAGQQQDPIVKVFSKDGTELYSFTAYHPLFRLGLNVAACDLDNDGKVEIITGAGHGGGPHVRVFNPTTGTIWNEVEFFAYASDFRGGVNVACGNIDNDAGMEIITGPGISGGPHLKVFSSTGTIEQEQFVGSLPSNSGLQVHVSNMDASGSDEIVVTEQQDGTHHLFVLTNNPAVNTLTVTNHALLGDELHNVSIGTFSYNSLPKEILVSSGYSKSTTAILSIDGKERSRFAPFTTPGHGSQTTSLNTAEGALQVSMNDSGNHRFSAGKYILVDISEQRLYMIEHAALQNTFLISSGLPQYETPRGKFDVMAKLPTHTYRWSYGEGDGRNYNIPNVKWNLRFKRHFYIHSANWHNNFGKKMSHGCVNVKQENAEKVFAWADVGTSVEITD